jgi:hypothetical protein
MEKKEDLPGYPECPQTALELPADLFFFSIPSGARVRGSPKLVFPETWQPGTVHTRFLNEPALKIARGDTSEANGWLSYFD